MYSYFRLCFKACSDIFRHYLTAYSSIFRTFYNLSSAWKVSKYGVFSRPYFPAFRLNVERYFASRRFQPKCGKTRTRKISVFEHFSGSVAYSKPWHIPITKHIQTLRYIYNTRLRFFKKLNLRRLIQFWMRLSFIDVT